jgi:dTMP kinase
MDDRSGVPLTREVRAVFSGYDRGVFSDTGLFIAFEGGEGAGKSTQVRELAGWLEARGFAVLTTHEPGATEIGRELRRLLLYGGDMAARTEALLYAADKAEHVDTMIRPALDRGTIVLTDRYVDTMLAYQGAGRKLSQQQVLQLSRWATGGLRPHLTVLLDLAPEVGLHRSDGAPDRLEREPLEFHRRARQHFLDLAALDPDHYLVLDATAPASKLAEQIRQRIAPLLDELTHRRSGAAPGRTTDAAAGETTDAMPGGPTDAAGEQGAQEPAGPTPHDQGSAPDEPAEERSAARAEESDAPDDGRQAAAGETRSRGEVEHAPSTREASA